MHHLSVGVQLSGRPGGVELLSPTEVLCPGELWHM